MKDVFDENYKKYDAWYDKHRFAFLSELEALKKVIPLNERGLEIGVGTGRFASALGVTMGIDPSGRMLDLARMRGLNVRLGFAEDIPFLDGSFDYVAIIITLCFVKDRKKTIEEASRVLKSGGKLIIGIVDKNSFLGKVYLKKDSVFYKQAELLSVKEVSRLLKMTGFISLSYYQTISVLPAEMKAVEKPHKGFGKGGFVVISAKKKQAKRNVK